MNLKQFLLISTITLLFSCGGDDAVDTDTALANKPTIYGLGISISDIPVSHAIQPRLFNEFGMPVNGSEGNWKNLAHPEFYLPMNSTLVTAVSDGVVRNILQLNGTDDVLIMVTPDDAPLWTIGYEHVSNVLVSVGDRIVVGQNLASLSPENQQFMPGYGKTALMVLVDNDGANNNLTYCPFNLLHDSVKQAIYDDIDTHVQQWSLNPGANPQHEDIDTNAWISKGCVLEYMFV